MLQETVNYRIKKILIPAVNTLIYAFILIMQNCMREKNKGKLKHLCFKVPMDALSIHISDGKYQYWWMEKNIMILQLRTVMEAQ